ncbi:unnamed protein product [Thelazia callipaeda]|uniref:cAMP-regulated phosphoprotein 19 n=1 Tax=Thelazia callipaeda TaxID=103827 RepID=A0A0N5CWD5_THECL|nr:unnamed protein product [Thelazia callipaeda]
MRGDVQDLKKTELAAEGFSIEKQQEQLLMNKLATSGRLPSKPQTAFLQKKLQQQRKFFDSGDYAMNKEKTKKPSADIPKTDLQCFHDPNTIPSVAEKKLSDVPLRVEVKPLGDESLLIPRPDTVPQRKSSIIYPSVHSKLSPQPHIHHSFHDNDAISES